MVFTGDDDARQLYEQWHLAVSRRDTAQLAALYARQATYESPAVLLLGDASDGVLEGREEIASFFNVFFRKLDEGAAEWFRTGELFMNGRLLAWQQTSGDSVEEATRTVDLIKTEEGLILRHWVYWSWRGFLAPGCRKPGRTRGTLLHVLRSSGATRGKVCPRS